MVSYPAEQTGLMTLNEFVRLYESEGPFELIDGERVPMAPTVLGHNKRSKRIYDRIIRFDPEQRLGVVYFETPYVLIYSPDWVKGSRVLDVMFVRAARMASYETEVSDYDDKPLVMVPDLVIEVISEHDHYSEVEAKVDRYLEDGVELVLVVDPRQKTVTLRGRDLYKKLRVGETLTGMSVIPGFEMPVAAIFE